MLELTCRIEIGDYYFVHVNDVRIESTWRKMTDTCVIKLPRNIKLKDEKLVDLIQVGNPVKVYLGYNGELREEFRGYVVRPPKSTTPVEIECEDEMWNLKKGSFTHAWADASLDDVLKYILGNTPYKTIGKVQLGAFSMSKATPAKVLDEILKTYGLHSFFRNGVLQVGTIYNANPTKHRYHFQKNVISNNLEYRSREDAKVKVKAISILADGSKIEAELGDSDGEERTLHFYNLKSATDLQNQAKLKLRQLKYDGYRGTMLAFGIPEAEHGDIAILQGTNIMPSIGDSEVSDHDGEYYIDGVVKSFGMGGYRRELSIGVIASQAITAL